MSRKLAVVFDNNVFVCDNTVELCVFAHVCVLHEDAVFHNGVFAYLGAAEDDAVFNRAFDLTTVGDQRIFNVCGVGVLCGGRVSDLCALSGTPKRASRTSLSKSFMLHSKYSSIEPTVA